MPTTLGGWARVMGAVLGLVLAGLAVADGRWLAAVLWGVFGGIYAALALRDRQST
jgi:hypothetical protein